jgi:hypothetical protein
MAAALPIRLNGAIFDDTPADLSAMCAPISIDPIIDKIGTLVKGKDGTRNWMHRAHERGWNIHWEDAPDATRAALETIYQLTTTFTYRDEHGTSYTVQCEEGGWQCSTGTIGGDGEVYYSITLTIWKA